MKKEYEPFINDYLQKLNDKSAAIFAGAGLSVGAGYVNWKELLRDIADELRLDIEFEKDLVSLAQYHVNTKGGTTSMLTKKIIQEFAERTEETENHRIIARLPITTFWTTNYDKLIENTLGNTQKIVDVKYSPDQMTSHRNKRDAVVYKMHGDVDHPSKAILIKEHFERYFITHSPFITALSADLVSRTFLFLGISFSDPNLSYVLSRLKVVHNENVNHHYCLMKKVDLRGRGAKEKAEFEYNQRRQELMLQDLLRYGIHAVEVDTYEEITEVLREIERRYKQQTIFISGSAEEFGSWEKDKALSLLHNLSKSLIKQNYRVVNGFGWGVGGAIINGALEMIYEKPDKYVEDQLILRPFPQDQTGKKPLPDLWQEYRERMISFAGVALFVFGNKKDGGNIINAGGVRKEFEIAKQKGCVLIPIGVTGYMSEELWQEVVTNFSHFYPNHPKVKPLLKKLGDNKTSSTELIKTVLEILKIIQK